MDTELLKKIIEGALLAANRPLSLEQLEKLFEEGERPDRGAIRDALKQLGEDCEGRGYELKEVGSGFRFQVRETVAPWVSRLWEEKPPRYTRALLETLALIAYRQPITRAEIEEIRGVAVSTQIVKTLTEREWVRVVGHRDVPGRPALFGTTRQFLDYFNLKTLDELPTLAELRDLDKLHPELDLDGPGEGEGGKPPVEEEAVESTAPDAGEVAMQEDDVQPPEEELPRNAEGHTLQ
ncbi:SMC-Scp complex subunit ScpB [Thioalkalivibrio sulfidiphilus]|uniref:Segregation and condensation protein B n=1 Tax=Thioalkalivibrio sulfidiphilus (strain HL-EbGR7) TaxID=396588 RepID=B8GT77_THISH|nr:SMC-Scp complex subunit ScpB [Thioalkalivibrio sulfidiphilus]ACL73092.1 segregation and condensation protein B [Thioalkalivibrio sulfidiphilus HL-EbGr7]